MAKILTGTGFKKSLVLTGLGFAAPSTTSTKVQNLYHGSTQITNVYHGSTQITKVYSGSTLIWEN